MHDSGDEDSIMLVFVKDCERETQDNPLAYGTAFDWARLRELFDSLNCLFDCG